MSDERSIHILGTGIPYTSDYHDIGGLRFLGDNPRVYAATHGQRDFADLSDDDQQSRIYAALQEQPGFASLRQDVKRHGGLMEPVLIRHDTKEVIEGNTRLAVYRSLHESGADGEWDLIPCNIVAGLTADQQAAFLNQIHVTGKTQWSAYEKANFAYVRVQAGIDVKTLANLFGESAATIRHRVSAVRLMADNDDSNLEHYSHYDVLVRKKILASEMGANPAFRDLILGRISCLESLPEEEQFTAQDLRDKLPVVLKKKRYWKRFVAAEIDLDEAHQLAKISRVEENVRRARELLANVERRDVGRVDANRLGALSLDVRRLKVEMNRVEKLVHERRAK